MADPTPAPTPIAAPGDPGGMAGLPFPAEDLLTVLAAVSIGIVVIDPTRPGLPVIWTNASFGTITGFGADEVIGRDLGVLFGPQTDPQLAGEIDAAAGAGRDSEFEAMVCRKDGRALWVRLSLRAVRRGGQATLVVAELSDITERRLAAEAAREYGERLQAYAEALPLPTMRVRPDGIIVEANLLAHETLRLPAGQLVGRNIGEFCREEHDIEQANERLSRYARMPRIELQARRGDGAPLWVLASAQPLTVRGESSFMLAFQDVTALKQREQALTEANEQAERTIRARTRFLAAASHDLRQPLQALALFASALDAHAQTPQGRTIVQSMKRSLTGMEEMFDSLLDMSKLEAGVMKAEPQVFLVNDILERLEADYGQQAAAAGLGLRVVPSSVAVRSDPRLLTRILGNFLSNAIRYTRSGRILMGCRLRGNHLKVSVSDTGPGVPEKLRLEIFREFRQGAAPGVPGRGEGTGLGLAIVQRLARLLTHNLDLRSTEGKGSEFSIQVPLAEAWQSLDDRSDKDSDDRDIAGATVVLVDDDPQIRDGLKMLLEHWGCRAVVAASAGQAMEELDRSGIRPDLILADLHLGEAGSGDAAIQAIHTHAGAEAPAFLFTGDTEAPAQAQLAHRFPVLRKPIDPARLRDVLADALGR